MKKLYVVKTVSGSEYLFAEEDGKLMVNGRGALHHTHIDNDHTLPDVWVTISAPQWPPVVGECFSMFYYGESNARHHWRRTSTVESVTQGVDGT